MRNSKLTSPATFAAAISLTLGLISQSTSADPLPTGTFKIVGVNGICADVTLNPNDGTTLYSGQCVTGNLGQQFTYNPLTKQVLPVALPGSCLAEEIAYGITTIKVRTCDASNLRQQFEQWGPDSSGTYYITGNPLISGYWWCLRNDQTVITAENCSPTPPGPPNNSNPKYHWTLPPI
ncbi:RICIN domain-containing protein [Ralstonia pseudosolanacearum]|uniref:RICIN domain-containing protein n=1 Tax=Ralstonia pseudosolanacearum TaxID=1310165 RepID=UPI001FF81AFE|nr:RICIN domain-containing protein [Ralstonia pseudosolanacearum]